MKLIFLHGSPAVGKLTVAKALLRLVQGRLMDNHANVDLARKRGKVTSAEGLIDFLDGRNFTSVPREECIKFDTGTMPPDAVAREIVDRFRLASWAS